MRRTGKPPCLRGRLSSNVRPQNSRSAMSPSLIAAVALVLSASSVLAQSFGERVAAAKAEAQKPAGKQYEQSLYPFIGQAMRTCVPPGGGNPNALGNFTYVASVSSAGAVRFAAVQPDSSVARCFHQQFLAITLPAPPHVLQSPSGLSYPIVIEMKVTP